MTAEQILAVYARDPALTFVCIARRSGWSVRDVALLLDC